MNNTPSPLAALQHGARLLTSANRFQNLSANATRRALLLEQAKAATKAT